MARPFKIVTIEPQPVGKQIARLKTYLAANVGVAIEDNELAKAAEFQEYLDVLDLLVDRCRGQLDLNATLPL